MQLEKLVVSLEARVNQFEKAMAKATNVANRDMGRIERSAERLDARLSRMGGSAFMSFAKGALLAAAPILTVSAAVNTAKDAMEQFGNVADNAKAAGLDAELFQSLAYQAQMAGVDIETLSGSLATFNRNSGLADAGTGRMVTALQKLNPELLDNIRAATTQEQRIRLAVDALDAATTSSEKAALAVALFGSSGTKLVDAFAGGAAAIDSMQAKAKQLGLIVDRDIIARADALGDEFETVTQIVDLQLKQALVNLGPILIWLTQMVGGLASAVNFAVEGLKPAADATTSYLDERYKWLENGGQGITARGGTAAQAAAEKKRLDEMASIKEILRQRALADLTEQLSAPPEITFPDMPEDADLPALPGSGGGSRSDAAASIVDQAKAVRDLVADLQFEQEQLGRTAEQQELYNALKSAGVTLESSYGQEIEGAMTALQAQRSAIEKNAEAMELFESAAQQAMQTVIDGFREGKSAGEIFGDLLADVGQQLLSMGISSISGSVGAALFPGVPKRERGGSVRKGQPYIVGEKRAELFVPGQSGTIIPRLPEPSMAGGPAVSFPFAPVIDARGADPAGIDRLMGAMAKQHAEFEGRVKDIVRTQGRKWK